jgi:hypothetical protein
MPPCRHPRRRDAARTTIRRQSRIVVAAIAVFVSLAGMMAVVTGLLFDERLRCAAVRSR